jgi:hypothetical protein
VRWYFFRRAEIGMTASGPSVWTGRALQAENDDLEMIGLALLYPAPKERLCSWPSWIIRARSISFATRPRRPEGPPDHERAGETFSPFLLVPTRRPRRESQLLLSGQTGHQTAHRISGTRLVAFDPLPTYGEGPPRAGSHSMPQPPLSTSIIRKLLRRSAADNFNKAQTARQLRIARSSARKYIGAFKRSSLTLREIDSIPRGKLIALLFPSSKYRTPSRRKLQLLACLPSIHTRIEIGGLSC